MINWYGYNDNEIPKRMHSSELLYFCNSLFYRGSSQVGSMNELNISKARYRGPNLLYLLFPTRVLIVVSEERTNLMNLLPLSANSSPILPLYKSFHSCSASIVSNLHYPTYSVHPYICPLLPYIINCATHLSTMQFPYISCRRR